MVPKYYKPIAIKLPSLVIFLSLFGLCIALIEYLLSRSTSTAGSITTPSNLQQRQVSQCDASIASSQSSRLESSSTSLCSQLTSLYDASSTAPSQVWQSGFNQWRNDFDSVVRAGSDLVSCTLWAPWTPVLQTPATMTATILEVDTVTVAEAPHSTLVETTTTTELLYTTLSSIDAPVQQTLSTCIEPETKVARDYSSMTEYLAMCSQPTAITQLTTSDSTATIRSYGQISSQSIPTPQSTTQAESTSFMCVPSASSLNVSSTSTSGVIMYNTVIFTCAETLVIPTTIVTTVFTTVNESISTLDVTSISSSELTSTPSSVSESIISYCGLEQVISQETPLSTTSSYSSCNGFTVPVIVTTVWSTLTTNVSAPSTMLLTIMSTKTVTKNGKGKKRSPVQYTNPSSTTSLTPSHLEARPGLPDDSVQSSTEILRRSQDISTVATTKPSSSRPGFATVTTFTTVSQSTATDGQVTRFGVVYISSVTLASSPVSSDASTVTTSVYLDPSFDSSVKNPEFKVESFEVIVSGTFTDETYFTARYLVPIMAVLIKAYGEVVVTSLKLVEPFHRLASTSGATSSTSLSSEYLSSSLSSGAINALREGHLLTMWSLAMHMLLTIATPLVTSAMIVKARDICMIDGVEYGCDPTWIINTIFLRTVESIMLVCFVFVSVLIFWTWRYYISLPQNPSSITSMIALLNHGPFLVSLQKIDPEVQDSAFAAALLSHRYWLALHEDSLNNRESYGILSYRNAPKSSAKLNRQKPADPSSNPTPTRPSYLPSALARYLTPGNLTTLTDLLHLFTTVALLTLLFTYYFNRTNDSFNNFFNSGTIYPRLVLVSLSVIVDIQIKYIERVIRITEPYRRLSLCNSRPETTISLTLNGTCWSNLLHSIYNLIRYNRNGHMLWQTAVTIVACLSDFNIIFAAGVPQDAATTWKSFLACIYGSMIITGLILLVVLITMIWWRTTHVVKHMPRRPNTIGTVCGYLCGSEMVRELNETYEGDVKLMLSARRWYTFGKMKGVDGEDRWCVDFEREDKESGGVDSSLG